MWRLFHSVLDSARLFIANFQEELENHVIDLLKGLKGESKDFHIPLLSLVTFVEQLLRTI